VSLFLLFSFLVARWLVVVNVSKDMDRAVFVVHFDVIPTQSLMINVEGWCLRFDQLFLGVGKWG
jgi:hypothetical protein